MLLFRTLSGGMCYIDVNKVVGVVQQKRGSRIVMEGGSKFAVRSDPRDVVAAIGKKDRYGSVREAIDSKIEGIDSKIEAIDVIIKGNVVRVLGSDICASGETETEMLVNLKDIIEAKYSLYSRRSLGPGPAKQMAIMKKLNFDINGNLLDRFQVVK